MVRMEAPHGQHGQDRQGADREYFSDDTQILPSVQEPHCTKDSRHEIVSEMHVNLTSHIEVARARL